MTSFDPASHDRRSFLTGGLLGAATLAAAAGGSQTALAQVGRALGPIDRDAITPGDVAILKFLAAAELVEDDLWQQEGVAADRPIADPLCLRRP